MGVGGPGAGFGGRVAGGDPNFASYMRSMEVAKQLDEPGTPSHILAVLPKFYAANAALADIGPPELSDFEKVTGAISLATGAGNPYSWIGYTVGAIQFEMARADSPIEATQKAAVETVTRYGEQLREGPPPMNGYGFVDDENYYGVMGGQSPTFPVPSGGDSIWPSLFETIGGIARGVLPALLDGGGRESAAITPTALVPAMGTLPAIRTGAMGAIAGIRAGSRVILRMISQRVGQRVTAKNVMALVKRVGPEAAAAALGVTVAEIMQVVTTESMKRRRRRGVSARDISRARSTIRRVSGFMSLVASSCGSTGARRYARRAHRPGCACVVCRRG